ncbi:kinase-like domain-containing protein [Cristinia sonorae]|uniref:Kinase-like domain-containing protein n=1 Tax=Cristinia sonorae TaxID=1940300 RepID=A0A8K0V190_9AGAR|nr:kinase-like domain-containing protein [Cristinia sonorae]
MGDEDVVPVVSQGPPPPDWPVDAEAALTREPAPDPPGMNGRDPDALLSRELFWRDHQPWLKESGYLLRPRYRPGWIPSWKGKDEAAITDGEDSYVCMFGQVMDATRLSDGEMVLLKRLKRSVHPYEIEITRMFSEEPLRSHPKNHCVPVFEVLDSPHNADVSILVLPLLREFENPSFETVGEVIEFFRQIFEGLQFMHQCHVAHRDCMFLNIMLDPRPMFPKMYHPASTQRARDLKGLAKHYSRTYKPTKYYLIDFGISRKYDASDESPLEAPIFGGDKSAPEFKPPFTPCNPFPTDVYYIGNVIRTRFLQKSQVYYQFMEPLISSMVQDDPKKRPTMDEVVDQFDKLCSMLPSSFLRTRFPSEGMHGPMLSLYTFILNTTYRLMGRKALPRPPKQPIHSFTF